MSVEILPLLVNERGEPRNPRLFEMAANYAGGPEHLAKPMVWCALEAQKNNGRHADLVGIATAAYILDTRLHCSSPEATLKLLRRANERLVDTGFEGAEALVYVKASEILRWRPLLERIKAVPAERWSFTIKSGVEV